MSGASTSTGVRTAFSYCVQQVRSYDYHHYLCLLELPPNMRKSAFALRAFNVETARAMDIASDPRIGLMRLLWWQEAIDKIFSKKINDAKREVSDIPETVEELERYAEDTMSTILYSTLQAGGIRSTAADHAASHIGKASGLVLLLKSLPYHASRNRHFPYIPVEVAEKHGLLVKDQGGQPEIRIDSREGLCNAVFEMASVANSHLEKARALAGTVPAEAHPVLLPALPTQMNEIVSHELEGLITTRGLYQSAEAVFNTWASHFRISLHAGRKWKSFLGGLKSSPPDYRNEEFNLYFVRTEALRIHLVFSTSCELHSKAATDGTAIGDASSRRHQSSPSATRRATEKQMSFKNEKLIAPEFGGRQATSPSPLPSLLLR
ncbi:UNVERIFIED_CONTAM: NADH dehydrogenase (ubiquinone) complex I, assembly factor 6 [Sesamum radiatum]|uniref:NADH dehydrogenase (Ubiquinone) complex I, assembly factor 6 n=1 Tax=Sesamum radiatum TaxID=300843 RepID=A0AAW2JPM0_SESRA